MQDGSKRRARLILILGIVLAILAGAGTFFYAWRADPLPTGSDVSVIHHPSGDLKKWAAGMSPGVQTYTDGSTFWLARYSQGSA